MARPPRSGGRRPGFYATTAGHGSTAADTSKVHETRWAGPGLPGPAHRVSHLTTIFSQRLTLATCLAPYPTLARYLELPPKLTCQ